MFRDGAKRTVVLAGRVLIVLVLMEGVLRLGGWIRAGSARLPTLMSSKDGIYRILCLGGCEVRAGWSRELGEALSRYHPARRIEVINEAFAGGMAGDILRNLPAHLEKYDPDMVITQLWPSGERAAVRAGGPEPPVTDLFRRTQIWRFGSVFQEAAAWKIREWKWTAELALHPRAIGRLRLAEDLFVAGGKPEVAERFWRDYVRKNPDDPAGYFHQEVLRRALHGTSDAPADFIKACRRFEERLARQSRPDETMLAAARCFLLAKSVDLRRAAGWAESYRDAYPDQGRADRVLTDLYERLSRPSTLPPGELDMAGFREELAQGRSIDAEVLRRLGITVAGALSEEQVRPVINKWLREPLLAPSGVPAPAIPRRAPVRGRTDPRTSGRETGRNESFGPSERKNLEVLSAFYPRALAETRRRVLTYTPRMEAICWGRLRRFGARDAYLWLKHFYAEEDPDPVREEALTEAVTRGFDRGPVSQAAVWKEVVITVGEDLRKAGRWAEALRLYSRLAEKLPRDAAACLLMAIVHRELGDLASARAWFEKADRLENPEIEDSTWMEFRRHYVEIQRLLAARNVRLVVVSAPLRGVGRLTRIFDPADDILFVDSRTLFQERLAKDTPEMLFRYRHHQPLAGTTPEGSRLMAENIAETIVKAIPE